LKDALENALLITCKWMNIVYEPEVEVYHDFDNFAEGNADLEQLRKARDAGDLSQETYWKELKRRRVLSSEFECGDERERLLTEVPGDEYANDTLPGDPVDNMDSPDNGPLNMENPA